MIDFNNPYLTLQQKQDILGAIAQGHKVSVTSKGDAAKTRMSFKSHWILRMSDLWHLNKMGEMKLTTTFVLNQEKIEKYYPDFSVLLFESDRIEQGEWDNFEHKWAGVGCQHTLVLGCNGFIKSVDDQGCEFAQCNFDLDHESNHKYTSTLKMLKSDQHIFVAGLLDVPLDDLARYEDKRHYKEVSSLGDIYSATLRSVLNSIRGTGCLKKGAIRESLKRGFGC